MGNVERREGKEAQELRAMLYADHASIVSRSLEGLGVMMTVIVTT